MIRKVVVLAGGPSCEREVSLVSGKAVREALQIKGFEAVMMDPAGQAFLERLRAARPDIVFIALHGSFGEDGTVQRLLEQEGLAYTGSGPAASADAFDKSRAQCIFKAAGLSVPEFSVVESGDVAVKPVRYPVVVKPSEAGSSVGITIVRRSEDLDGALALARAVSPRVLIERFIAGREITVGILGGQTLPAVEVIPGREFYDYEAKYGNAGTRYEFPAKLSLQDADRVSEQALRAFEALGCRVMGRADFILTPDGATYLLEMNSIPGLTGKSLLPKAAEARGISFADLCVKIITLSLGAGSPVASKKGN